MQRGAALCPFAVFSHSNVIYPLRASAVHVAYSREPQSMRLYDRSSAIHAAYTAGIPQSMRAFGRGLRSPCGYYFPIQNFENISLTRSFPQVILPESVPDFRMHLSGLWIKILRHSAFYAIFYQRRLSCAFKSSCLWRSLVM